MKNLVGITVIASILFSCNGANDTNPASPSNAELRAELTQAKHETEILKLQHELDLVKAKGAGTDPALLAALENSRNAYLGNAFPNDSRRTQSVDNEWIEHETKSTDAYKTDISTPSVGTPTVEKKPTEEVKKKKGMSTPVKGALIGAGVGAATGAVVAKNHRVKGAVIGAVVGAGAGAGTGVIIDKRTEKKAESTPYFASNTFLK